MAARLTDRQKKKILADYVELQSYNAVAKIHGVARQTVKNIVATNPEIGQELQRKKEQNTADILAHMDRQREAVCEIIDVGLEVLPEKIRNARTASEVTTAIGTLIDKYAVLRDKGADEVRIIDDL